MRTFTEEEVEEMMDSGVCEKSKTNADRIRSFSDEELADFIFNLENNLCEEFAEFIVNLKNHFCEEYEGEQSCLSWLQKESEEQ